MVSQMTPQLESNQLMDGWMMMVMNNNIIIKSVTPIAQASCCGVVVTMM
jgi:hypothetical protein